MWCDVHGKNMDTEEVDVKVICNAEHAMKLFVLAKTMYDTEKFDSDDIEVAVRSLALKLNCFCNFEEITSCVMTWVERFDEMSLADLEEWIIG